ncbi:MAG TPA: hypothetical protein PLC65_16375 [Bacteroidia bacterium]|nr:hypothetical protein [Bacteroidia bacterium]MBN8694755.1 hypothetical protein [Bacteroidota bacterium]HRD40204.1 hypothetical protein [Bacteroidia bacterium]
MKKEEIPQDKSALEKYTRDMLYVKNADGKYTTALSTGWEVKKVALDNAWEDINERVKETALAVKNGEKSPVAYYMELKLMDLTLLSAYTGFWKFNIKRHMKPSVFAKLSDEKLSRYAKAFDITLQELKNFKG